MSDILKTNPMLVQIHGNHAVIVTGVGFDEDGTQYVKYIDPSPKERNEYQFKEYDEFRAIMTNSVIITGMK